MTGNNLVLTMSMNFLKKLFRTTAIFLTGTLVISTIFFFTYSNSLRGVAQPAVICYKQLQEELTNRGYGPTLIVISAKRAKWHNELLTQYGAAKNSEHLNGTAIDILVLDVNEDGEANAVDVDIVVGILEELIGSRGGIGTYKTEEYIWNRQMVHFDTRGYKARWNR